MVNQEARSVGILTVVRQVSNVEVQLGILVS